MSMDAIPLPSPAEDEISLLDLLVTVSENIKLLILGPLAAGLCAGRPHQDRRGQARQIDDAYRDG
jgi:hypothetical protein